MTEERSAASLTATVLEEEAARQAAQAERNEVLFAEDLLPGVGAEEMSLKQGLAKGGAGTFMILMLLNAADELEAAGFAVLGPDIGNTFGISDGTVQFLSIAAIAFVILGAVPLGLLADRAPKRAPFVGLASVLFGILVTVSGFVGNAFQMALARFGIGMSKSNTVTLHTSLLSDAYPIEVRGRIFATKALVARSMGGIASPLLMGGIAIWVGGEEGWRWAFILVGIPALFLGITGFFIKEPLRGRWEKQNVLGTEIADDDPAPIAMDQAFQRLWKINTLRNLILGIIALGFGIFGLTSAQNLYLEEAFGLDAWERGQVTAIAGLGILAVVGVGGYFDRLYRRSPEKSLRFLGMLFIPAGLLIPVQWFMPNEWLFAVLGIPVGAFLNAAFALTSPVIQSVAPYRLRGMAASLVTLYLFVYGAILGGIVSGILIDEIGERPTIMVLMPVTLVVAGLLIFRSASLIRNDLSLVVSELQEEQAEHDRQAQDPESIPVLQVNEVDFSYGPVQVLFDVAFEVQEGEVLALLGTNGAGKSTILNVIAGLGTPERGVVRLDGRTITYTSPEQRTGLGIHMLAGGKGVFSSMSVRQNLVMGAYQYRHDNADVERRIAKVLDIFPDLRGRQDQIAGSMSGGQQQQLALARTLLHEPRVLIIDELSLGLAPVVVADLIGIVETLKAEGLTMIIVEQSLNVALAISDRAVFLEKGQVRFTGDAKELAQRDDLARAVFLGTEGG